MVKENNAMSDSPDLSRMLEAVRLLASRAVHSERSGQCEMAAHLYRETVRALQLARQQGADTSGEECRVLTGAPSTRLLSQGWRRRLPPTSRGRRNWRPLRPRLS